MQQKYRHNDAHGKQTVRKQEAAAGHMFTSAALVEFGQNADHAVEKKGGKAVPHSCLPSVSLFGVQQQRRQGKQKAENLGGIQLFVKEQYPHKRRQEHAA